MIATTSPDEALAGSGEGRADTGDAGPAPSWSSNRLGLSPSDLLIAALLLGLVLGNVPALLLPDWSFRYALVIASLPAGAVALAALSARRDRGAWFAIAFIAVAIVSAAASPSPRLALLGAWGAGTSVPLYAGAFAIWAIARHASDRLRALAPAILAVGLGINVLVGVLQVVLEIDGGPLATINGRASGFLGNAVYFGAVMAAFTALCTASSIRSTWSVWLLGCVAFGFATGLSGSRIAVVALLVVSAGLVVGWRSVRAAIASGCSLVGLAIATLVTTSTSSTSTVERFANKGGDGRTDLWRFALQAAADRPLLGWGLGNHSQATRPQYTLAYTRDFAQDEVQQAWSDPHNVVLHVVVATGAIGLACVIAFLVTQVLRFDRAPLVAMVAVVVIAWTAEPVHIATLPLTMLLLGMAVRPPERSVPSVPWAHLAAAGVALGAVVLVAIVALDRRFEVARSTGDAATMGDVTGALLDDPRLTAIVGDAWTARWSLSGSDADGAQALRWTALAADRDPGNSYRWADLARRQVGLGRYDDARRSLDRAFQLHPLSPMAWQVEYALASVTRDTVAADRAAAMICDLELPLCPGDTSGAVEAP